MTIRMPKEMKRKWLEALRSGEYKQGTGALKTDGDRYCCLGVLQHVLDGTVETVPLESGGVTPLGIPTVEWNEAKGICTTGWKAEKCVSLPYLNDTGYSFNRIADVIEQHVEGY